LRACKVNQDAGNSEGVNLFELADVFVPAPGRPLPEEHLELAMVWASDVRPLRGVVEEVFDRLAPQIKPDIRPASLAGFENGACGEIRAGDKTVGVIGMISPAVLAAYGLKKPQAAAAINLSELIPQYAAARRFRAMPRFPAVVRDLSFIVEESLPWARLASAVDTVKQPLRTAVEYVTTYRGKPIPDGRKSVTLRLTYRSEDGTLRAEDAEEQVQRVVAALKSDLSAELRS
jgi:phenylalanyl-tRNA synthetase beta chain